MSLYKGKRIHDYKCHEMPIYDKGKKIVRPDLEPALDFLCTRVAKIDEDDCKKLRRLLDWV